MSIGVFEVLVAARGRIRKGWTQNVFARRSSGYDCSPWASHAVCWCAEGAVEAAAMTLDVDADLEIDARNMLENVLFDTSNRNMTLAGWNDAPNRTQEEVLGLFDLAVASFLDERTQEDK